MKRARETTRQKVIFVMIDGLADVSIARLGNKTPIQAANIPMMDAIARAGINGLMDPVEPGLACGSDTAHLSILGYPPRQYYRGRGAFESMGAGLEMKPGDIAFKSNFATIDPSTNVVVRRRADRDFEHWGRPLCDFLTGLALPSFPDCRVDVKYATEHRCGVRVRGPNLTDTIRDTDPLKDNLPLQTAIALEDTDESRRTASLVNELSTCIHKALVSHPLNVEREKKGLPVANIVLLRGCGSRISVQPFSERHGFKPFMIAPTCIIAGLGMSLGIDIIPAPGATGDYHTNLRSKAEVLVKNITDDQKDYSFGFLHVKAVDDAGHDKNVQLKVDFIEKIDREILQYIIKSLADDSKKSETQYVLALTGDHSTPVEYGDHSCEPVPFSIAQVCAVQDSTLHASDHVAAFSEIDATHGILGRFPGGEVMSLIKKFLEHLKAPSAQ